jgi:hypothetical protein
VHRHYLISHSHKISFNFLHCFCFSILTFVTIYSCAVEQTINKIHENEFL